MNGLIWQKSLLHVHSPWGNLSNGEKLSQSYTQISNKEEFLEKFVENNVEILSITDHHEIEIALELKNYVTSHREKFPNLIIIPGLETTSQDGVHVLILINHNLKDKEVIAIYNNLKIKSYVVEGNASLRSSFTIKALVDNFADDKNVQIIFAHISTENTGFLNSNERNPLVKEEIVKSKKCLFEIIEEELENLPSYYRECAVLLNKADINDFKQLNDIKSYSFLKLPKPFNFQHFKQIRFLNSLRMNRYNPIISHNYIKKIEINSVFYSKLDLTLNPGLNVLIGSKGTGKSIFVESIGWMFDKKHQDKELSKKFDDTIKYCFPTDKQSCNLNMSDGKIIFRNNLNQSKFDGLIPSFIFQSDYDTIAKRYKNSLISEIDKLNSISTHPFKIIEYKNNLKQIVKKIDENSSELISYYNILKDPFPILKNIYESQQRKKKFESLIKNEEYRKYVELSNDNIKFTEFKQKFEAKLSEIKIDFSPKIDNQIDLNQQINKDLFDEYSKSYKKESTRIKNKIEQFQKYFLKSLEEINSKIITNFNEQKNHIEDDIKIFTDDNEQLKVKIETETRSIDENKNKIKENQNYVRKILKLEKEREVLINDLRNQEENIKMWRDEIIKFLLVNFNNLIIEYPSISKIELKLIRKWDTHISNEIFKKVLANQVARFGRHDLLMNHFLETYNPKLLFDFLTDSEKTIHLDEKKYTIRPQDLIFQFKSTIQEEILKKKGIIRRCRGVYNKQLLNLEKSLQMNEIKCKICKDGKYIELDEASIGEQHAILINLFSLIPSNQPLIIDQPEDELDHIIKKSLTSELSKLKENRQIILVTHFPNIPVCADADLILHCKGNGEIVQGVFTDHIKFLKDMEGGEKAIKQRICRYLSE